MRSSPVECNALTCWVILPKYKVVLKIWMVFLMFKISIYQINRTSEFLKGSKVMFTRNKHITKVNYDAIKANSGFDKNLSWDSINYITVILKFWRSWSKKSIFWDCCYFKPNFLGLTPYKEQGKLVETENHMVLNSKSHKEVAVY